MSKSMRPASAQAGPAVRDYRLLAKLGEGGMGVVHLAQAPDGRRVALKVLRPHVVGDDEARQRLSREVTSLRRVRSPRVAEVLDADPWGETPFVVTRYVPGLSLHEHVRDEGPIRGGDLRWFAAGLMEAVVAVHAVGVLHRDIKPSNVLLEGRSPVLIDFGLARLVEDPRITHTGWLLGTPGYLAPEILYGDDATTASDVHSWAATVVFAATGEPPFGTGPALAIMDRVRRGEHRLAAVPDPLRPLLQACLSPDPLDRPSTREVLARLAPAPVSSAAPSPGEDFTRPFPAGFGLDDRTVVLGGEHRTRVIEGPPGPGPTRAERTGAGLARAQRGGLQLGTGALVTIGFARAPYLCLLLLALAALGMRTASWATEAAQYRAYRRGRSRWYDGLVTAATTPWYLVVAAGGTLVLLVSSAVLVSMVGLAYLLFRAPLVPGLLVMGAVLALCLWWGPGSRRVRTPTRRLLAGSTRRPWLGWVAWAVVAVALALCTYGLLHSGVLWAPRPGPPWRPGTLLGDVVGYL